MRKEIVSAPDSFAQEMTLLETELKRLEVEYTQFFSGNLKRPPSERRARVEAAIRRHDRVPRSNTAERYRFETLQARYAALRQLWDRKSKSDE
jgi:hypothetical protein